MEALNEAKRNLQLAVISLLSNANKVFYASFLMRMNVSFSEAIPSAGVSITDKINFIINPTFFNSMTPEVRQEIIEHEIEHIVKLHPIRAKKLGEKYNHETHHVYNLATDAEINGPLTSLHEMGVTVHKLNELSEKENLSVRFYQEDASDTHYWKLKDLKEQLKDKGVLDKYTTADSHESWEESTSNEELARSVVKEVANGAVKSAGGVGNVPGNLIADINNLNKSSINWKQQLRQFFAKALRYDYTFTRKKRNRRYGLLVSGRKKNEKLKVAVCVDTSGSVSDAELTQFWAEIEAIFKAGVEVIVIEADYEIQNVYTYDKNVKPRFQGRGGTNYGNALKKAKELEADVVVYLGDGDCADNPEDPKIPVLWAIVRGGKNPSTFGKLIHVDVKN